MLSVNTYPCANCNKGFRVPSDLFPNVTHVRCCYSACEQTLKVESGWIGTQIRCSFCDYSFELGRIR